MVARRKVKARQTLLLTLANDHEALRSGDTKSRNILCLKVSRAFEVTLAHDHARRWLGRLAGHLHQGEALDPSRQQIMDFRPRLPSCWHAGHADDM